MYTPSNWREKETNFKELWHKVFWRKIELISRLDKEMSEKLMNLFKQKSVNYISISDQLRLDKVGGYREYRPIHINVYFNSVNSLNQYNNILTYLEPFGLSFKKTITSDNNGLYLTNKTGEIDFTAWVNLYGIEEKERIKLLGEIMGCELITITESYPEHISKRLACKNNHNN